MGMVTGRHKFVNTIDRALSQRCGVGPNQRLLVAVSGGGDSVALLRALLAIVSRAGRRLDLVVGHVQHHLRDSDGQGESDAEFVKALCERFDLPMDRMDLHLNKNKSSQGNLEDTARRARYNAFGHMARRFSASVIACAHHSDDQLETILMRLMRGTSISGLSGMDWRRQLASNQPIWIVRPMLATDHAAALSYLEDLGQNWCEDRTNRDVSRLRARLRHEVLPVLASICPTIGCRVIGLTDHLRDAAHVIQEAIEEVSNQLQRTDRTVSIDRVMARALPPVILNGLLRKMLIGAGARPDQLGRRALDPIVLAVHDDYGGCRRFDLSGGTRVTISRTTMAVTGDRTDKQIS